DEQLRAIASPLHWIVGLLLPVAMGAHLWERRRLPAQARSRGPVLVGAPAAPRRAEREAIAAQPRARTPQRDRRRGAGAQRPRVRGPQARAFAQLRPGADR